MAGYDDLEAVCFFVAALRAAQYLRMRSAIARRFAGVNRGVPPRCVGARVGVADMVNAGGFDDTADLVAVDGFVTRVLAAARRGGDGAISMPNIADRSSLASTFAPAGPLRVFERSDPAFAIRSC